MKSTSSEMEMDSGEISGDVSKDERGMRIARSSALGACLDHRAFFSGLPPSLPKVGKHWLFQAAGGWRGVQGAS
jgi:hypothetical protein